jgi:S-adenosylmethionine:tRNA ribosyltransferase-isomerase
LSRFQYALPSERIAQYPSQAREQARLLMLDRRTGAIDGSGHVSQLVESVCEGDVWVINDTRVRRARVLLKKESGGRVELLVTRIQSGRATAMYRSSKPLREGQTLLCERSDDTVTVLENVGGGLVVVDMGEAPEALLARAGQVPLPPYITRAPEDLDETRYQTVYADQNGAVAAPTAGLHLTRDLMAAMEARGARFAKVTLHVGPGTFRPIRDETIENHSVGSESYVLSEESADIVNSAQRVIAVGTTSVRTLETLAVAPGRVQPGAGETNLYITPGDRFQVVDAMLTNFHLPGSSLIVLVAAFAGLTPVMDAYQYALDHKFRFYSYGDAMLIS